VASSVGLKVSDGAIITDTEFANCVIDLSSESVQEISDRCRNLTFSASTTEVRNYLAGILVEDYDNIPGDTRQFVNVTTAENLNIVTQQSETVTIRSGGSNVATKVTPTTSLSPTGSWKAKWKLLDVPIYATTDSKTYEIYFRPTATTDWTADPTAAELWIELAAWGHATNNHRKLTKSTGVIDMNGSTAWQALSVTVAPAQAGVAYLRVWYCKTKESAKANTFFMDPIPVIS
jgi:hypothetical protein